MHHRINKTWESLFDRVFCIHYSEYLEREAHIRSELERIGILGSNVLEWRITYKNEFEQNLARYLHVPECSLIGPLFIETKRIISESLFRGYERILLIEDDATFLRDVSCIDDMLRKMPSDANVIQFEKRTDMIPERISRWRYLLENRKVNDEYVWADGSVFWGGSCYALSRKGMVGLDAAMSDGLINQDNCFGKIDRYAIAIRNMCIQRLFDRSEKSRFGYKSSKDDAELSVLGLRREDYGNP